MINKENFGRSPAMDALPIVRANNATNQAALLLQQMIHTFVPSVKAEFHLTQAQGSAVIQAREWLARHRRAIAAHVESRTSE